MNKETVITINITRTLLMLGVIFLHSGFSLNQFDDFDIYGKIFYNLLYLVSQSCVPCYFIISGYLFFYNINEFGISDYKKKIKTRINSLLVPYIIWNIIAIVPFCIYHSNGQINELLNNKEYISLLRIFWDNGSGFFPLNYPLWYLRDLIVIILCSPIVYFCVKMIKVYFLLFLILTYLTGIYNGGPGFSITTILFFSIGAYMGIYKFDFISIIKKMFIPLSIVWIGLFCVYLIDLSNYAFIKNLFHIIWAFYFFSLFSLIKNGYTLKLLKSLSQSSFFAYATHALLIAGYCGGIIAKIFANSNYSIFMKAIWGPILTLLVCHIIYLLMKRFVPKILNILIGNRI